MDAEFQNGITAVAAGDEKKAREIFDGFLARYPLDARARQILFIYGQFRYAAAQTHLADGETALLAPLDDEAAFVAAAQRLVGDLALARRLGRAAREAGEKLTWDSIAGDFEKVLKDVAT